MNVFEHLQFFKNDQRKLLKLGSANNFRYKLAECNAKVTYTTLTCCDATTPTKHSHPSLNTNFIVNFFKIIDL